MDSGFYSSMPFAGLSEFRRSFSFSIYLATSSFLRQTGKLNDLFQINKILWPPEPFIKTGRYNLTSLLLAALWMLLLSFFARQR